jgi:hypothetical protein
MIENVMNSNPSLLSHQKVENYIQSLNADPSGVGTLTLANKKNEKVNIDTFKENCCPIEFSYCPPTVQ